MAAEQSGVIVPVSSPVSQDKPVRNGKHCHQCRQNREVVAECKNQRKNRPCLVRICSKCLLNRYGEKSEEVATLEQWSCPKCRGICNCSVCMKRSGHRPTGILITTAKATGFSSVSEMLHNSADRTNTEKDCAGMTADLEKGVDYSSRMKGKENTFTGKLDANFQNLDENEGTNNSNKQSKMKNRIHVDGKKPKKSKREGLVENDDGFDDQKAECLLPVGTDLTSVADIDMPAEDIGNALQFLEFCSVFEKILDMKKGEAEHILEVVLLGKPAREGKSSLTVQLHMRLLSMIQTDHGEKCVTYRFWFNTLKKFLCESKHISKEPAVLSLEKADDYEALSATEKLRILNLLCDEVLGTETVRKWISNQHTEFHKEMKEAKKVLRATTKDTIASCSKSEPDQSTEQSLELKGMLSKSRRECDALRIKPRFIEPGGSVYWILNCNGEHDVLHQNVGKGDTLTLDEKWYTIDDEGKETIENYISSLRKKKRHKITADIGSSSS